MADKKNYTIGIDIGGTKMRAILFDGKKVVADYELATPHDNFEHLIIMLKALLKPLQEKAKDLKVKINGIGLGIAGALNSEKTKVLGSPNLEIVEGIIIPEKIREFIELPVAMDNDVNCFVRAETILGVGKGHNNVYGVTIGTGIGGGWWFRGEVYSGSHGGAGEPGEIVIDISNEMVLEKMYQKITQNNPGKLAEEAYRGDPLAEQVFSEVGKYLGVAFANIVNLIDPEVIIVGGGVVESSDLFLTTVKKTMKEYIYSTESSRKVKILKSKLGENAVAIGAALLV